MVDLYEVLGISPTSDERAIERAIAHHQLHKTVADIALQVARQYLLNPQLRPRYNAKLFAEQPHIWEDLIVQQQQHIQDLQQQIITQKTTFMASPYAKILVALVTASVLGALGWAYYSPYYAVKQMHQALKQNDVDALSEYVDYAQLQYNVKNQWRQKVMTPSSGDSELKMIITGAMVDQFVSMLLSPEGLKKLTEKDGQLLSTIEEKMSSKTANLGDIQAAYRGVNEFTLSQTFEKNGQMQSLTWVLHREGLGSWKLADVEIPALQDMMRY